jgi:hypothetical protein
MSQTINNAPGEEKATITVVEDVRRGAPTEAVVKMKSQFDRLSILEAISTFRKTALICLVAGFCASTDGEVRDKN